VPIITWGGDTIAIQKGDSILVGVTPFLWETDWVYEDDAEPALGSLSYLSKVTVAEGVPSAVGTFASVSAVLRHRPSRRIGEMGYTWAAESVQLEHTAPCAGALFEPGCWVRERQATGLSLITGKCLLPSRQPASSSSRTLRRPFTVAHGVAHGLACATARLVKGESTFAGSARNLSRFRSSDLWIRPFHIQLARLVFKPLSFATSR